MKQVVVYLEPTKHASLKEEARIHRRTLGQQLLVKAFGIGMPPMREDSSITKKGARK